NVIVQDSPALGVTWNAGNANRTVRISANVTGRRFMPWVCALGGRAHVAWYDRRGASPGGTTLSNNSLTDLFRASAALDGAGNLVAGPEDQDNEESTPGAPFGAGPATGTTQS